MSLGDRPNRVDHIAGWEVIGRRDLGLTAGFKSPLCIHDRRTVSTELHTRKGMDRVVNAGMVCRPTAGHLRVSCIHNRIDLQPGDIPAPKANLGMGRGGDGVIKGGNTAFSAKDL